ncbi:MAG: hypothetical protein WBS18_09930, partial [Candidatus Acidiferrales bacterium]
SAVSSKSASVGHPPCEISSRRWFPIAGRNTERERAALPEILIPKYEETLTRVEVHGETRRQNSRVFKKKDW